MPLGVGGEVDEAGNVVSEERGSGVLYALARLVGMDGGDGVHLGGDTWWGLNDVIGLIHVLG